MSPVGSLIFALATARAEDTVGAPGRLDVALSVGAGVSLSGLGLSASPGVEAGYVLGPGGRLTVLLGADYRGGHAEGRGKDPSLDEGFAWTLDLRSFQLNPGIRWRILPWTEAISPELALGPTLAVGEARVGGKADGAAFPETREPWAAPGGWAAAGIVGRVGPGLLEGRVSFSLAALESNLTGSALLPTITPSVGYRILR